MMFVNSLNDVKIHFLHVKRGRRYIIFGFLLYTNTDTGVWNYLHISQGAIELNHLLNHLSHDESTVFVLDEPPPDFVEHLQKHHPDHTWFEVFAPRAPESDDPLAAAPARPQRLLRGFFQKLNGPPAAAPARPHWLLGGFF
jgi:hypothetical protein